MNTNTLSVKTTAFRTIYGATQTLVSWGYEFAGYSDRGNATYHRFADRRRAVMVTDSITGQVLVYSGLEY